jgi:hypothetical protein
MKFPASSPRWTSLAAALRLKAGRSGTSLLLAAAVGLTAGSGLAAAEKADAVTLATLKKVSERYALTKDRISSLLDERIHPTPLPNNLPNPFYHPSLLPTTDNVPVTPADVAAVPAAPDISDADTLAKFAASIKISGVVEIGGQLRLTINSTLCKPGDVILAGTKDHPVYIQVVRITPDEATFGLNQSEQTVRVPHK